MKYIITKNDKLYGSFVELTEDEMNAIIDNSDFMNEGVEPGIRKLMALRDHVPGSKSGNN